jgi:hypothetical protein
MDALHRQRRLPYLHRAFFSSLPYMAHTLNYSQLSPLHWRPKVMADM